jgi:hypothetical protein
MYVLSGQARDHAVAAWWNKTKARSFFCALGAARMNKIQSKNVNGI